MKFLCVVFLIVLAHGAFSQKVFDGQCPKLVNPVAKSFDLKRFAGPWWGIERYPFLSLTKCTVGNYIPNKDGTLTYINSGISKSTGKPTSTTFEGRITGHAELSIKYDKNQSLKKTNAIIIGIDYDCWVVVYFCKNISKTQHEKTAFVLGRKPKLSKYELECAHNVLTSAGVDLKYLEKYDQTNCA